MTTHPLRSRNWFGRQDIDGFAHRSWLKTLDHVPQAHEGCDFDFLRGGTPVRAEDTAGPSHA
jgi:hypothetical protein